MKYICSVCGYVYDEEAEKIPFASLPDDWVCPMCRAPKNLFVPEESEAREPADEPQEAEEYHDSRKLSPGVLAAIFSNLARGAEKQYRAKEAEAFSAIAAYFTRHSDSGDSSSPEAIRALLSDDLSRGYPDLRKKAAAAGDRGAARVLVWGEKVTRMASSLLERYEKEGEAFLAGTSVWLCTVCGFIYIGDNPPGICPVCKVPSWKFTRIE